MPMHVAVPDLLSLTVNKTGEIITSSLNKGQGELANIENVSRIIKSFLSVVPVYVREIILHYILEFENDDAIRYTALKIMLCPQMKTLRTYIFPETYYKRIASVIGSQGQTLELLDLRGVWLKGELNCELKTILYNLKDLHVLHIPHVVTDNILETIGQSDPPLKLLDIRGECNITSAGVKSLCNSKHSHILQYLSIVVLGNPTGDEISPEIVSQLIKNLPNLQSLGSYPNVRQAIDLLIKDDEFITTNLVNLHDSHTDLESINLLIQTCPSLKSIYLDHPNQNVIPQLVKFKLLDKIKLNKFKVPEFCTFVEEAGPKILAMELMFGVGILDLSIMSKFCSSLESLTCYQMDCLRHLGQVEFKKLKNIEICYSDITSSCVKSIMEGSQTIEKLSFGDVLEITDEDIIEIFTSKEFPNLTSIWFPNAINLTSDSIQILINCCPKLTTLGVVSGWYVTEEEAYIIKNEIQAQNLAIKLIDYFFNE